MIRLTGGILVILGCCGLGCWFREQYQERIRHIRILISIIDMMKSEVRYCKAALPECLHGILERLEEPYREAFTKAYEDICENTGESPGIIFQSAMKECLDLVPLEREEKKIFWEFAGKCGFEDAGLQLGSMERYRQQLREIYEQQQNEVIKRGRLAVSLGAMSGVFIVIMLL